MSGAGTNGVTALGPNLAPAEPTLRIDVPDAVRGFRLVQRLGKHCALTGSESEGWTVVGSANRDLSRILTAIQSWLEDETIDHVTVHVGDHSHSMTRG
jgi:hypothetical protein